MRRLLAALAATASVFAVTGVAWADDDAPVDAPTTVDVPPAEIVVVEAPVETAVETTVEEAPVVATVVEEPAAP
jgi:hypothetical protein